MTNKQKRKNETHQIDRIYFVIPACFLLHNEEFAGGGSFIYGNQED